MAQWLCLAAEEARAHPLSGVRGWLVAYCVGAVMMLAMSLRNMAGGDELMLIMFETEPHAALIRWVMAAQNIALPPFLILVPMRHAAAATLGLWGIVVYAALRPFAVELLIDISPTKVIAVTANHMVIGGAFIAYMLWSRRFNVTLRHRVRLS